MLQLELLRRLSRVHLSFTKSEVKRLKKAVSLNSRCVGTLGMEQSLPGNMKTNSEEFPHLFFEPVLRSNCRNLSLEGHGLHLTGRTVHPYLDQCTDEINEEDISKYRLKFMLDKKELTLTLDDFRTIFHLPQPTDNNHNSFVPPPSFSDMVSFYKKVLGFTMELKTSSSFKTTGHLQP
ncbi:hypothetical protein Tco_0995754 [Tanacetum coccineum]